MSVRSRVRSHILITGGAGFIGSHFARMAVAAGHEVTLLDNLSPQVHGTTVDFQPLAGAHFIKGDVTVRADVERAVSDVDTVVHLAADTGTGQSMYEIDRYYRVNVQGTALLFDVLANKEHKVSNVVLASSRSVYGEGAYICRACEPNGRHCFPSPRSPQQLAAHDWSPRCPDCLSPVEPIATREDDRLAPASIYAATKLAQEDLVRVACNSLGIPHAILRFQNVFGEGQSLKNPYTGILSIFSTRFRLGLPIDIFEDGEESRDFVHVEDVAAAILQCAENRTAEGVTLNVGRGEPVSVMALARLLGRQLGSDVEPAATKHYRVGDIRHNFADMSRFEATTGLMPRISLEEGLKRFCDWVTTQPIPDDLLATANAELEARKLMG
jgi:dTDP-L-rhamnose 4-epimerase